MHHSLEGIWNCLRPIIKEHLTDGEMGYIDTLQEYTIEFHNYNPNGNAFRYLISKRLNL